MTSIGYLPDDLLHDPALTHDQGNDICLEPGGGRGLHEGRSSRRSVAGLHCEHGADLGGRKDPSGSAQGSDGVPGTVDPDEDSQHERLWWWSDRHQDIGAGQAHDL